MTRLRAVADIPAKGVDQLVVAVDTSGSAPVVLAPEGSLPASGAAAIAAGFRAVADPGAEVVRVPSVPGAAAGSIAAATVRDRSPESARRAIGAALRTCVGAKDVAVIPAGDSVEQLRAAAEGALFGAYRFLRYRTDAADLVAPARILLVTGSGAPPAKRVVTAAESLAAGVCLARDLGNTPPNDLTPARLSAIAKETFADTGVRVKVWDDRALRRGGFGGLTGVGQGSVNGPRLVRLEYRHPKAQRSVALVGKGVTFDSGGLSLKQAKAMEWMKADMSGAAAVLASVATIARDRSPVDVIGWLALAENMPSGTAQRPGDVITIRGGKTVEVLNTDAEGRLVLADALVEAAKDSPDEIVDIATLTSAQLVALGSRVAGVMGNDSGLRDEIVAAGEACGEPSWPMPLPPELRRSLDSPLADLANIGDRNGGMLTAALFLQEFVPSATPWAHIDIAGPSFNEGAATGYLPKGATGFGVRTLVEFLHRRALG